MDTQTAYMGLNLRSPLVLTDAIPDVDLLLRMEEVGVGAVVLQPLLEEELIQDIKINQREKAPTSNYGINFEYISKQMPQDYVLRYIENLHTIKKSLSIPVIASIDCYSFDAWFSYIQKITETGCDAIELNIQLQPFHPSVNTNTLSQLFESITSIYKRITSLPLSLKISSHYSDLTLFVQQMSWMGVKNITLFNTAPLFDIDLQQMQFINGIAPHNTSNTLMWTALCHPHATIDLSSVVNNGEEAIKALLFGATTAHISHRNGCIDPTDIQSAHTALHQWMQQHNYNDIADFRSKLVPTESIKNYHSVRNLYIRGLKEKKENK